MQPDLQAIIDRAALGEPVPSELAMSAIVEHEFPAGKFSAERVSHFLSGKHYCRDIVGVARLLDAFAERPPQDERAADSYIDIVFDGPPGASASRHGGAPTAGRFVEVENASGRSIRLGEWVRRDDGYWVIRFKPSEIKAPPPQPSPAPEAAGTGDGKE